MKKEAGGKGKRMVGYGNGRQGGKDKRRQRGKRREKKQERWNLNARGNKRRKRKGWCIFFKEGIMKFKEKQNKRIRRRLRRKGIKRRLRRKGRSEKKKEKKRWGKYGKRKRKKNEI